MSKRILLMWLLVFMLAAPFVAADTVNALVGFSDTTVGAALIAHRTWDDTAKNFSAKFNTSANVGGTIGHMLGRGNRLRNEFVYGAQDTGGDINFQIYNGTGWGNLLEVTANLTNGNSRAFDIAVLNMSGNALLVYENTSAPDNKIMFRLWNGTGYSAEQVIDGLSAGGEVRFIRAMPKPNSNDVMIVTLDAGADAFAVLWNGTTNTTVNATKINLTATAITATSATIDFAWETQSQDGLVVHGIADATQYRTFSGNAWSAEAQFFNWAPSAGNGDDSLYNVLCADPTSNFIGWIGKDNDDDVNIQIWNGTAVETTPTAPTEESTTEPTTVTTSGITCAFETNSGRAMFVFIDANIDDKVEFVTYNKIAYSNTTLESPARTQDISAATGANENLRLISNPVTNEIMLEVGRSVENILYMIRWNGSTDWILPTNNSMGTICNQAADPTPCFSFDWGTSVVTAVPAATAPANLTVEIGDDAQLIWNLTGAGGFYYVERNGTLFDGPRAWTAGQEIVVVPNTFFLGTWNYTLFFNNTDGTPGSASTTTVRVVDTIFPNCSQITGFGQTALIKKTITIDGNVNDWASVLDNSVQVAPDPTLEQGDPDLPGTADRDMTKFAYTSNQTHLFFYFERLAKGTNQASLLVYIDKDNDGRMQSTDRVAKFTWSGSNRLYDATLHNYVPVNSSGDLMEGDGKDMNGSIATNATIESSILGGSLIGTQLEVRMPWSILGLSGPAALTYKAAIAQGAGTNLPSQLQDNIGNITQPVRSELLFSPNNAKSAKNATSVFYAHDLMNCGLGNANITFTNTSTQPWNLTLFLPNETIITGPLTFEADNFTTIIARINVAANATGGDQDVRNITAISGASNKSVIDTTTVAAVSILPRSVNGSGTPGVTLTFNFTVQNLQDQTVVLNYLNTSSQGFSVTVRFANGSTTSDSNTDGIFDLGSFQFKQSKDILVDLVIPAGTAIGTVDLTTILINSTVTNVTTSATINTTIRQRITLVPNNYTRTAKSGTDQFFNFTLTNNGPTTDVIDFNFTDVLGYDIAVLDRLKQQLTDTDGDSLPDLTLEGLGANTTIFARITVPLNATSTTNNFTLVARSNASGATANATINVTPQVVRTFNDSARTIVTQNFSIFETVFAQGQNLDAITTVFFKWFDGENTTRTSANITVVSGKANDSYTTKGNDTLGTWTLFLFDSSTNDIAATTTFTVSDFLKPNVTDVRPAAGSTFTENTTIAVAANVTDNFRVDTVLANITFPNTSTVIVTLLRNGTTDQYTNNFTMPHILGRYNITYFANDSSGNPNNSVTSFFTINDTVRPAVFDVRSVAGTNVSILDVLAISANVTDNFEVGIVLANITFPNGTSVVISLLQNGSTSQYTNNFTVPALQGRYNITYFANDTSNNINNSVTSFFIAVEGVKPAVFDVRPVANTTTAASVTIAVSANATDNVAVSIVRANITFPNGTSVIITLLQNGSTSQYTNNFTIPAVNGIFNIIFIANDTSNNINSSVTTFFVFDNIVPALFDIGPKNASRQNESTNMTISVSATDNFHFSTIQGNVTLPNGTVVVLNFTAQANNIFNVSFPNTTQLGTYTLRIFTNDSAGNINTTTFVFFVERPIVMPLALSSNRITENVTLTYIATNLTANNNATVDIIFNGTSIAGFPRTENTTAAGEVFGNFTPAVGTTIGNYTLRVVDVTTNFFNQTPFEVLAPINIRAQLLNSTGHAVPGVNTTIFLNGVPQTLANETFNFTFSFGQKYDIEYNMTGNITKVKLLGLQNVNRTTNLLQIETSQPAAGSLGWFAYNPNVTTFDNIEININYTGGQELGVYKCDNFNFTSQSCIGGFRKIVDLGDGAVAAGNFTIFGHAFDPGFGIFPDGQFMEPPDFANISDLEKTNLNVTVNVSADDLSYATINQTEGGVSNGTLEALWNVNSSATVIVNSTNVTVRWARDAENSVGTTTASFFFRNGSLTSPYSAIPSCQNIVVPTSGTNPAADADFQNFTCFVNTVLNQTSAQNLSIRIVFITAQQGGGSQRTNVKVDLILYNLITNDSIAPAVFDVRPVANTSFNVSDIIAVSANVTDNTNIDTVRANITFPNGSTVQFLLLRNGTTAQYTNNFTIPILQGQYNISYFANDTFGNINNSVTSFFVVTDTRPPSVFDVRPVANTSFVQNSIIAISANVTDNAAVDKVFANITLANTSTVLLELFRNGTTDQFTNNFTIPLLLGRYNITFIANDTSNNINNTVTTFFNSQDVPSVTDVRPVADSIFNATNVIEVAANVTDNEGVDTVRATITLPNTSTTTLSLLRIGTTNKYANNFTVPALIGRYNVSFTANDTFNNINNSVTTFFRVRDSTSPSIALDQPANNFQTAGSAINFSFTAIDNFATVLNCTIRVNGTTANNASVLNGSLTNFSLIISEGRHIWNVSCTDTENNTNVSVNRNVTVDQTSPDFISLTTSPSDAAGLDPSVQISITANITDNLTSVASAVFQFKESNDTFFTNRTMTFNSTTGLWNATFTPGQNNTYNLRFFATDAVGNGNFSAITNISVQLDRTWERSPVALAASGNTSQNIIVGTLKLNNTGDVPLNFTVNGTNATFQFRFNATFPLEIPAGQVRDIEVNATTPSTQDVFTFTLNITAQPDASPTNRTTAVTITTAEQPFLFAEFVSAPTTATQGSTGVNITARLRNTGQANASNVTFFYTLPTGWTITDGSQEVDTFVLVPGANLTSSITVSIASNAATGNQTVIANATGVNQTGANLRTLGLIQEATTQIDVQSAAAPIGKAPGGGAGGAAAAAAAAAAAGAAAPARIFPPPEMKINRTYFEEEILTTEEIVELVRGEQTSFKVFITNVYENTTLGRVTLSMHGYLSQYLSSRPVQLDGIKYKGKDAFIVTVAAPGYRTRGEHELVFVIKGTAIAEQKYIEGSKVITNIIVKNITDTRKITLIIHEASPVLARQALNTSLALMSELQAQEIALRRGDELADKLTQAFKEKDFAKVLELGTDARNLYDAATESASLIAHLEERIVSAEKRGLDVSETKKLLALGKTAFVREDYELALKRLRQASVVQLVEVSGAFNIIVFMATWWYAILLVLGLLGIAAVFVLRRAQMRMLSARIRSLEQEEEEIFKLITETQAAAFKEKTISVLEYHKKMYLLEKRLERIKTLLSQLRTKRVALTSIEEELAKLREEKARVHDAMKSTQEMYFVKRTLSKVHYVDRLKELRSRLAEIESAIMTLQTKRAMHPKVVEAGQFWKEFLETEFWKKVAASMKAIIAAVSRVLNRLGARSREMGVASHKQPAPSPKLQAPSRIIAQLKTIYKEHPTTSRPVCTIIRTATAPFKQALKPIPLADRKALLLRLKEVHQQKSPPQPAHSASRQYTPPAAPPATPAVINKSPEPRVLHSLPASQPMQPAIKALKRFVFKKHTNSYLHLSTVGLIENVQDAIRQKHPQTENIITKLKHAYNMKQTEQEAGSKEFGARDIIAATAPNSKPQSSSHEFGASLQQQPQISSLNSQPPTAPSPKPQAPSRNLTSFYRQMYESKKKTTLNDGRVHQLTNELGVGGKRLGDDVAASSQTPDSKPQTSKNSLLKKLKEAYK